VDSDIYYYLFFIYSLYDKPSKSGFHEPHWMIKTESAPLLIEPQATRVYEGLPKNSLNSERLPQNSKVSERLPKSNDIPPSMSPLHNKSRFEDPQSSNNFPQSSNPNYMVPYQDSAFQSSDLRSDIVMMPFHDPNYTYTGPPSSKSAFQDRKEYSSEQQSSNVYNSVSQSSTSNVITSHDNQQDFQFRSDSAMFDSQRSNVYSTDPQSAKSTFHDRRDYSSELQSSKVHDIVPQSSKSTFQDRRDYSSEAQSSNVFTNVSQNSTSNVITSHDNHKGFESKSDHSQRSNDRKTADSSCPDLERLDRSYTSVYEEKNMSTSYASVYDKIAR
jgi:hypothetical protein